jgi:type I restriction enzyme S subunit
MSLKSEFRMGITTRPVTFNQDVKALIAVDDIVPSYLAYAIRSKNVEILNLVGEAGHGTGVLPTDRIQALQIPVPSIPEQQAIASILGCLDDKIELNRQTNATLQAVAAALFKSWFVDFDGVPQEDMQESELGLIPNGWRVATLEEHVDAERGLSYKAAGLSEAGTGVPMHNLNSVLEFGGYKYVGIKYYSGDYKEKHLAVAGDIIVANTEQGHEHRLIGFPDIVPGNFSSGIFSHHLYRVRLKPDGSITREWLYHLLMAPAVREQIIGCANGSTVNMLKPDGLRIPRFALPPHKLCAEFDAIAAPLRLKAEANVEQMGTLTALRDTLLPRLISGRLRIPETTRTMVEAHI